RPRLTSTYTDTWTNVHIRERIDRGLESVPVYKIIGSASRYVDFDRWLLQWDRAEQIRRKAAQTQSFAGSQSPIELYKVGEVYFVKDGNYRLESARARGQLFLPAHVVEYQIDSTLTELDEMHN